MNSQRARHPDSQEGGRAKRAMDPSPAPSSAGTSSTVGAAASAGAKGGSGATPAASASMMPDTSSSYNKGLGPDDSWHRDMCHNFLMQYRKYLMSEFGFICINLQPSMNKR